ncbi:MAG TPA: SDR family NAD(P)-dependent oxidoreductase, partial [Ilumatobacteraceae bacterium]|nr:SDR family NAD(P)-dependent oxidoreductase [Ilumatobacteraceae bacterium]
QCLARGGHHKFGGTGAEAFTVDLLDRSAVDELVPRVEREVGPVDVLVNNAGLESSQWLAREEPQWIRDVVRVNLETPLILTRAVLPGMLARGCGTVVFTSSLAGTAGFPGMSVYSATKAGLNNAAAALRLELRDTPVNVTLVAPGPVDTRMWTLLEDQSEFDPMLRRLNALHLIPKKSPELIATRAVRAVAKGQRHVRTPRRLAATFWLGEAPQRLTEALLARVPFMPAADRVVADTTSAQERPDE